MRNAKLRNHLKSMPQKLGYALALLDTWPYTDSYRNKEGVECKSAVQQISTYSFLSTCLGLRILNPLSSKLTRSCTFIPAYGSAPKQEYRRNSVTKKQLFYRVENPCKKFVKPPLPSIGLPFSYWYHD